MDLNEYQNAAGDTAVYPRRGNNIYYPALGLCGEAGEIAEIVKKTMRAGLSVPTKAQREQLFYELGDVLWYVAAIAHELGMDLDMIAQGNISKLYKRAQEGRLKKED
jgi:NTP pyrophosphatase (non-canonical NTP hydrolase)